MKTYQITLPDEFAAFVDRAVAEKKFDDVSHLVAYALGYVESELADDAHTDLDALRKAIQVGIDQADRGETAKLDLAAIWGRVQSRLAEKKEVAHAGDHANGPS
jgi:Arc/MetJ-type ribon-helix-helix transcriptional regulator